MSFVKFVSALLPMFKTNLLNPDSSFLGEEDTANVYCQDILCIAVSIYKVALWKREMSAGYYWIGRQTEERGVNDVSSFLWHLCMTVIMCKYLQAPDRNRRSLCITQWEYMFRCAEIKPSLGRGIMLFKRCNILGIWLRACTKLSFPFLFLSLSLYFSLQPHFLILSEHLCVCTNTQMSIPFMKLHLRRFHIVLSDNLVHLVWNKNLPEQCFYPKKSSLVMTNTLTHCCAHIASRLKDA